MKHDPEVHRLSYVQDVVQEAPAAVDEDGNIVLTDGFDMLDVGESNLYCSECGLVTWPEYAAHGISEFWEVM